MTKHHAGQCSWHGDQYEHECDCGVSRPATIMWAQLEERAALDAVASANERLKIAQSRLAQMTAEAIQRTQGDPA